MHASEALARLGAHGLPGAPSTPIHVEALDELLRLADARHALPWLAAAVDDGLVENTTDDFLRDLQVAHVAAVQSTMAAHAAAVSVSRGLAERGVCGVRVLKGCATAYLDYADPFERFSSDVDLLVARGSMSQLIDLFPDATTPTPRRRRWDDRYAKSTTLVDRSGVEIDLHLVLAQSYFGFAIAPEELRGNQETFVIGAHEMSALDGPGRLIHAAIHAAVSFHHDLNSARDVPQLVLVSEVDWEAAVDRAQRWRIESILAHGIQTAWSEFALGTHPIVEWARRHRPAGRQRIALRATVDGRGGDYLTAPLALPIRSWPGYLGPILFPSRRYRESIGSTWRQRARRRLSR